MPLPHIAGALVGLGIPVCTACADRAPKPGGIERPHVFYTVTREIALSRHEPRSAASCLRLQVIWLLGAYALLSGCMTTRPSSVAQALPWAARLAMLQHDGAWQLDGRAAVALDKQGWQATLNWRQTDTSSDVRLAGPFGVGALEVQLTPAGLALNGAPPSAAVAAQLQEKVGFALPLEHLRYWLLGVPDPGSPGETQRNAQDRLAQLSQAGWTVTYDRYMSVDGDLLPAHLVLTREAVRVRIVVDRWEGVR